MGKFFSVSLFVLLGKGRKKNQLTKKKKTARKRNKEKGGKKKVDDQERKREKQKKKKKKMTQTFYSYLKWKLKKKRKIGQQENFKKRKY